MSESSTGILVTGSINAPANLGGALLSPVGAADTVIAQFGVSDGAHLFSTRFGGGSPAGTGYVYGKLDTLDPAGVPLIHGVTFCDPTGMPACSTIDVGLGAANPGGGPGGDGFIGRYSVTTGGATWSKRLVGPGDDQLTAVTNGPNGSLYVAGSFDQSVTLLGGPDMRSFTGAGDRDILIAQLNGTTGEIGMTKTFAGSGFEQPTALHWTGSHLVAAGFFAGGTVFGANTLTSVDFDVWVAKLMPSDGTPVWAIRLGGAGPDKYPHVAVDAAGDIYLAGTVAGSAMFGAHPVGGAGGIDVFVAKLRNTDGSVVWATSFGSPGDDDAADIAISPSGQILVSGMIVGPIEVGGSFYGGSDAALVSYDSAGTRLWSKVVGTTGADGGSGVTSGTDAFYANVNVGADIGPSIESVPISGAPRPSGILLKLKR